jgi:hypothetical protein
MQCKYNICGICLYQGTSGYLTCALWVSNFTYIATLPASAAHPCTRKDRPAIKTPAGVAITKVVSNYTVINGCHIIQMHKKLGNAIQNSLTFHVVK